MADKPIIITVANQKGGVGKTTTVANLAACLGKSGKNILVIDCDYQANVTSLLCGDMLTKQKDKSFTQAIKLDLSLEHVVVGTPIKNVDLIPSNHELDELREQLAGQPNQFSLIDLMLDCKKTSGYDIILIDTHPSLDCFFQSAIAASHYFIIPLFPEADSSRGLAHQLQAIEKIKRYLNKNLKFMGCALVKYDRYNATHQKFEKLIRKYCKENSINVFKSNVPNSQSVAAAAAHGLPLFQYKPESPASIAYVEIAKEILRILKHPMLNDKKTQKKGFNQAQELEFALDL